MESAPREERFLVTGALGCIGAWTVRTLVREGVRVVGFDLSTNTHRLELIMTPEELARVTLVTGDITDLAGLERALEEHGITNVVHLAALLIPFIRTDPPRGALVNVVGTVNVFEAAKRRRDRVRSVVYASSVAAYDAADAYPAGKALAEDVAGHPVTHYGVHKQANEGAARVYWLEEGLPSVGLRPYIVYGPGRDQGLTAAPTQAMLAAARGESYRIPFGGRTHFQYAPDVARTFIMASRACSEGAAVFNLGGSVVHMREVVAAIEAAAPEAAGQITFEERPLPFPEKLEAGSLDRVVGPVPATPLEAGVRETIEHFRRSGLSRPRRAP